MPNISTTMYLNDIDYNEKYMPRKEEILKKMRSYIREELGISQPTSARQQPKVKMEKPNTKGNSEE